MKRIFNLIIIIAIAFFFTSCSKEGFQEEKSKNTSNTAGMVIKTNIKSFLYQCDQSELDPQFKSGEIITVDSAINLLEASINYMHAFPAKPYVNITTDTLTIQLETDSQIEVGLDEVVTKYIEMKQEISTLLNQDENTEKSLAIIDVEHGSTATGSTTLFVITSYGNIDSDPPPVGIDGPFGQGDNWWYGEFLGGCWPHTYDTDAANELFIAMNNYISQQNIGVFFIRPIIKYRKGGEPNVRRAGDPPQLDNYYDYYLYSCIEGDPSIPFNEDMKCLEWTEMNVYYSYLKFLIYNKIPIDVSLPPGYKIVEISEKYGSFEFLGGNIRHDLHRFVFVYGYAIAYDEGEEPTNL